MEEKVDKAASDEGATNPYEDIRKSRSRGRSPEFIIWIIAALLYSSKAIILFVFNIMQGFTVLDSLGIAASVGLDTAVVSIFIILLPVLFLQIFGELPFALLRRRILNTNRSGPLHVDAGGGNVTIGAISLSDPVLVAQAIETGFSIAGVRRLDPRDLLALYAERTSALTKQIYARAGVYLLGVVIK